MKEKLDECLRLEKYEDAIRIRDYITKLTTKIGTKDT
jgi:protein-arginine kinase activator protein McsA